MPKYLCLQRSLPGGQAHGDKPSPAQMQAMYTKFNEWREKFQKNLVDLGGKLGAGRLATTAPHRMVLSSRSRSSSAAT
jgi:hypothetical protein